MKHAIVFFAIISALASGCSGRHAIYTATGTVIGVELSQNPQTQMYQAKLGYNRGEMAIVPTNRSGDKDAGAVASGAKDAVPLILELRTAGLFTFSESGGIYQRLAVGESAVKQPGAAFMFGRGPDGHLSASAAKSIGDAIKSVPEVAPSVEAAKRPLAKAYLEKPQQKAAFDAATAPKTFAQFLSDVTVTQEQVAAVTEKLKQAGLVQ